MGDGNHSVPGGDPFTAFWSDWMTRMSGLGMAPPASAPDMMEQMRKTFFGAMARHAEEFMRSDQFLGAMKQSMDNALAFKQQLNQFLTKNLQSAQMPSRSDTDHVVLLVRGMEERLAGKLDDLSARVAELEAASGGERHEGKAKGASHVRRGR